MGNIRASADASAWGTTRQAGADQLFGSYPSRADGLCLSQLDHFARLPAAHGIIDMSSDSVRGSKKS